MSDSWKPKAVFFDFDGTLAPGSASLELISYLAEVNLFPKEQRDLALQTINNYENGKVSYDELCIDIGRAWVNGLKGKEESWIRYNAKQVFGAFMPKIYDSSFELVKLFSENNYTTVIVSSGAHEMISLAAKALRVKELYCTELEVVDGKYTGQVKVDRGVAKLKVETVTAMRDRFDFKNSFAFGDSVADENVMRQVGNPVALNAVGKFAAVARDNNWSMCTHEDVVSRVRHMLVNGRRKTRR